MFQKFGIQFKSKIPLLLTLLITFFHFILWAHLVLARERRTISEIVEGAIAPKYKYKPLSLLKFRGTHTCSGAILNENWVVTAAKCIQSKTPADYELVAVKHDKSKHDRKEQTVTATAIVENGYNAETKEDDIALLKVDPPFGFNNFLQPVVLPSKKYQPQGPLWVGGWSLLKETGAFTPSSLRHTRTAIIDQETCRAQLPEDVISDKMLCAGPKKGGKDVCTGDPGSPLFELKHGNFILVGIESWSRSCAQGKTPGVYTRISAYVDWIRNKTSMNDQSKIKLKEKLGRNVIMASQSHPKDIDAEIVESEAKSEEEERQEDVTIYSQYVHKNVFHNLQVPKPEKKNGLSWTRTTRRKNSKKAMNEPRFLSFSLSSYVCYQTRKFRETLRIMNPVKRKKGKTAVTRHRCAWIEWGNCGSGDDDKCTPFHFRRC